MTNQIERIKGFKLRKIRAGTNERDSGDTDSLGSSLSLRIPDDNNKPAPLNANDGSDDTNK